MEVEQSVGNSVVAAPMKSSTTITALATFRLPGFFVSACQASAVITHLRQLLTIFSSNFANSLSSQRLDRVSQFQFCFVMMQSNSSTNQLGEGVCETDWGNRPQAQHMETSLHPSVSSRNSSPHPSSSVMATTTSRAPLSRQPSVRIRRLPSQQLQHQQRVQFASQARGDNGVVDGIARPDYAATGRRRSSSDPRPAPGHAAPAQSYGLTRSATALSELPTLNEEDSQGQGMASTAARGPSAAPPQRPGIIQRASNATMSALGRRQTSRFDNGHLDSSTGSTTRQGHQEYDEDLVNILDAVGM